MSSRRLQPPPQLQRRRQRKRQPQTSLVVLITLAFSFSFRSIYHATGATRLFKKFVKAFWQQDDDAPNITKLRRQRRPHIPKNFTNTTGMEDHLRFFHYSLSFDDQTVAEATTKLPTNMTSTSSTSVSVSSPTTWGNEETRPTMFVGIFTMLRSGSRRQQLIRETMLNRTYICSYRSYERSQRSKKVPTRSINSRCKVIYAFVIGAPDPKHDENATEWTYRESEGSIARDPTKPEKALLASVDDTNYRDDDMLFLNICENMNLGKTPTWFDFASRHYSEAVDFIVKADDDSYINIDYMLMLLKREAPLHRPVYGGKLIDYTGCGGRKRDHCKWMERNRVYFSGEIYWISYELAQFISDPVFRFSRTWPFAQHEDLDISFKIWTYKKEPIHLMSCNNAMFWEHPLKTDYEWRDFLAAVERTKPAVVEA